MLVSVFEAVQLTGQV